MKNRITIQFLGLVIVNAVVKLSVISFTIHMARHWKEVLEGIPLPMFTTLILHWGFTWPIAAILLSGIGFGLAFSSRWNEKGLQALFSILVLAELICLSLHAYALVMPSMKISYLIG